MHILYILGSGRSGSSVLTDSIALEFPNTVNVGELHFVWSRGLDKNWLCGCRTPFLECPFWKDVFSRSGRHSEADSQAFMKEFFQRAARFIAWPKSAWRIFRGSSFQANVERAKGILADLYMAIGEVSQATVIVDSSKAAYYLSLLGEVDELKVATIHFIRDPRAVTHSWSRKKRMPDIHWEEAYMQQIGFFRSSLMWNWENFFCMVARARVDRAVQIRYRDFAEDSSSVMSDIGSWMDFPSSSKAGHSSTSNIHTISGNPVRFEDGPREIKPDMKWKKDMPAIKRALVYIFTLPLRILLALAGMGGPARTGGE